MGTVNFDPNQRWKGPAYKDPERVPMGLLLAGLLIGFVLMVWWVMSR